MPLLGGIELVREFKRRHLDVKVVMLTGHPLSESTMASAPEGIVGWIQKPPGLDQLAEAIDRALNKTKQAEQVGQPVERS